MGGGAWEPATHSKNPADGVWLPSGLCPEPLPCSFASGPLHVWQGEQVQDPRDTRGSFSAGTSSREQLWLVGEHGEVDLGEGPGGRGRGAPLGPEQRLGGSAGEGGRRGRRARWAARKRGPVWGRAAVPCPDGCGGQETPGNCPGTSRRTQVSPGQCSKGQACPGSPAALPEAPNPRVRSFGARRSLRPTCPAPGAPPAGDAAPAQSLWDAEWLRKWAAVHGPGAQGRPFFRALGAGLLCLPEGPGEELGSGVAPGVRRRQGARALCRQGAGAARGRAQERGARRTRGGRPGRSKGAAGLASPSHSPAGATTPRAA